MTPDNDNSDVRHKAAFYRGEWLVLDLWAGPGNYLIGFKNQQEAEAEARRLNGPHLVVVDENFVECSDDDEAPHFERPQ